jgi:uncharacterized protein
MDNLPCQGCKGLCCGPVSITQDDLKRIKRKLNRMPVKIREELKNQKRYSGTCIFYDIHKDRCGIYESRPKVCIMFGYYKGMACFKNPALASKNSRINLENPIGILSLDYKWDFFL